MIIADEPTSGIDAVLRAEIMSLLSELVKKDKGMLLITHDLAVASNFSHYIYVMKSGEIVECGDTVSVIQTPKHEYTELLLSRYKESLQNLNVEHLN